MAEAGLRLSCKGCIHFFITYDAKRPWGCHKFGFKGKILPALTVYQSTGMQCAYFEQKPSFGQGLSRKRRGQTGKLDMEG